MKHKLLLIGNITPPYGAEAQIATALRNAGHQVDELLYPSFSNNYSLINGILESQLENKKYDFILCGKCPGLKYDYILELKKRFKLPIIQFVFDKMTGVYDTTFMIPQLRTNWWIPQAKAFDKVFNAEDDQTEYYNSIGINHSILREGADTDIFKPLEPTDKDMDNYKADVVFVGCAYNDFRKELISKLSAQLDFTFIYHKNVRMQELNKALNCAKISVTTNWDDTASAGWSARVVEHMSSGIMILSPKINHMEEEGFIDKQTIVYYDTRNVNDMIDKIRYYLKHDNERKEIGINGRRLIEKRHSWSDRINKLIITLEQEKIIK